MYVNKAVLPAFQKAILPLSIGQVIGGLANKVRSLFSAGEQGVWYDPSDLSTLFQDSTGITPVTAMEQPVGLMLDKSGRGNHATQATSASRPVVSARVNLLTKSDQPTDAQWAKNEVSVSGDTLVESTANSTRYITNAVLNVATVGGKVVARVEFKKGVGSRNFVLRVGGSSGSAYAVFNPSTGALVSSATTGSNWALGGSVPAAQLTQDGWWLVSLPVAINETGTAILFCQPVDGTNFNYVGDGVSSVRVRNAQLEYGAISTRYQRVNTATDYDTAGFPVYLKFDGVDDYMTTASVVGLTGPGLQLAFSAQASDLTGTTMLFSNGRWWAGRTLSALRFTSAGAKDYDTPLSTLPEGKSFVAGVYFGGDFAATLRVNRNEFVITHTDDSSAAETALNVGRMGTSQYWKGNLYAAVLHKGAFAFDPVEKYLANKAGVTLP